MSITTPKTITITLDAYTLELLNEFKRRQLKRRNETPCDDECEDVFYLLHAARMHMSEENERPEPQAGEWLHAADELWSLVYPTDPQTQPTTPEGAHAA